MHKFPDRDIGAKQIFLSPSPVEQSRYEYSTPDLTIILVVDEGIKMDKGDVPIRKEKPSEYGTYKERPY
jgi:hypothetical protein